MNIRQLTGTLGAALAFAASAGPVAASTCYVVLDRGENVIYQSTQPPVDLSATGFGAREAMRRRGEFMESFESTQCVERNALTRAGKGEASVDEIVAGVRPYQRVGRVGAMARQDEGAATFAQPSTDAVQIRLGN
jgi:hypothetical protein